MFLLESDWIEKKSKIQVSHLATYLELWESFGGGEC